MKNQKIICQTLFCVTIVMALIVQYANRSDGQGFDAFQTVWIVVLTNLVAIPSLIVLGSLGFSMKYKKTFLLLTAILCAYAGLRIAFPPLH